MVEVIIGMVVMAVIALISWAVRKSDTPGGTTPVEPPQPWPRGTYRYEELGFHDETITTCVTARQAADEMHARIKERTDGNLFYETEQEALDDFCALHGAWWEE